MANRVLTIKRSLTGKRQIRLVEIEEAVTGAGAGLVIRNGIVGHNNIEITAGTFAGGNVFDSSSGSASGGSIVFKTQKYDNYGHSITEGSDGDRLGVSHGLCIYEKTLQHTNKMTAGTIGHTLTANTFKYPNAVFDTEGHISNKGTDGTLTFTNGIVMSTAGAIGHANSITAGTFNAVAVTNTSGTTVAGGTITTRRHTYDAYGHITSANTNDVTITLNRGLGMYSNAIGHTNNITANTSNALKSFAVDANGHVTSYTAKSLGRGLSDSSNTIGHSNAAITASTANGLKSFAVDAYGHVTAYTVKSLGRGLSDSSNVIGHSNSITAGTAGLGSTTACITGLKWDAQGHITAVTTSTMYPPTTVGTSGQFWKSDGSGQGVWGSSCTITEGTYNISAWVNMTGGTGSCRYRRYEFDNHYDYEIEFVINGGTCTQGTTTTERSFCKLPFNLPAGTTVNAYALLSPMYKSGKAPSAKPTANLYATGGTAATQPSLYLDYIAANGTYVFSGEHFAFHFKWKK